MSGQSGKVISLTILVLFFAGTKGRCPDGWQTHRDMCYHFSHDTESWMVAQLMCREMQGHLVEIEDAVENEYLHGQVGILNHSFWIGLSDFQDEGTWIWAQQKNPAQYTNWKPNEPNNSGSDENCALIYQDGKWNDGVCHNYAHYICEIKDETVEIVG